MPQSHNSISKTDTFSCIQCGLTVMTYPAPMVIAETTAPVACIPDTCSTRWKVDRRTAECGWLPFRSQYCAVAIG